MNKFLHSPFNEDESDKTGPENVFKTRVMHILEMPTQGFESINKLEEDHVDQDQKKKSKDSKTNNSMTLYALGYKSVAQRTLYQKNSRYKEVTMESAKRSIRNTLSLYVRSIKDLDILFNQASLLVL